MIAGMKGRAFHSQRGNTPRCIALAKARTFARRAEFSPPYMPPEKTLKLFSRLRARTLRGGVLHQKTSYPSQRTSGEAANLARPSAPAAATESAATLSRECARTLQTARSALLILRPQARFLFSIFLFFKKRNVAAGGRLPPHIPGGSATKRTPPEAGCLSAGRESERG